MPRAMPETSAILSFSGRPRSYSGSGSTGIPLCSMTEGWLPLLATLLALGIAFDVLTRSRLSATTALACEGEYSDSLQAQSPRNREIEQGPRSQFSYLVRSSAKYECPFFGPDGKLRTR